jgi:hypothetical protein
MEVGWHFTKGLSHSKIRAHDAPLVCGTVCLDGFGGTGDTPYTPGLAALTTP